MSSQILQSLPLFVPSKAAKSNRVFFKCASAVLIILMAFSFQLKAQKVVDATTMDNKVLAGYQGWFKVPGDTPGSNSWAHLFGGSAANPTRPGFDTWPDMSEYPMDAKVVVPGYTHPDGSPAYLYSGLNAKAVMLHFQWMKQYDIDGVWLSQFCNHFPGGGEQYDAPTVYGIMKNVQAAAQATGRTWAFMWDMSGLPTNSKTRVYDIIINNWKKMVDEGVTSDPRYMHDKGKPVLLIWGFFPNRPASQPETMNPIIDFLLAPGKYQASLVGGVDNVWRAKGTPEFKAMLMRMQGLQPWSVGRRVRDPLTGYSVPNTSEWFGDIKMCEANNVKFMPVFNSGTHVAGPPPTPPVVPAVPRRGGNYFWEQFVAASKTGVINSAFVAMFDEINEGTQLYKVTNKPPTQLPFLTYDGATPDYFLRLLGAGTKLLKTGKEINPVIPVSAFDSKLSYQIKNRASKILLTSPDKKVDGGNAQDWQLDFDGNGYYVIRDRSSGKMLSAGPGESVTLSGLNFNKVKWHVEWDGSSYCRIINKATGKALSNSASGAVSQVADAPGSDSLRWQIISPI